MRPRLGPDVVVQFKGGNGGEGGVAVRAGAVVVARAGVGDMVRGGGAVKVKDEDEGGSLLSHLMTGGLVGAHSGRVLVDGVLVAAQADAAEAQM